MNVFEKFLTGALALIAVYLLFNSQRVPEVISSIASGTSKIFSTLQGRGIG